MITVSKQISAHFHSTEFRCKCGCGQIKIDENLVNKMENIFTKLNASKCIISSGYRCPSYDKIIGGFVGRHAEGLASDCCYYDKDGNIIPSKYVICAAYDLDELRGIAMIRGGNYTHLDNRSEGYYKGDESVSNNSVWSNPYDYFGVSKNDMAKYTGEVVTEGIDVLYKVKTQKHGWLSEVKNLEDYAGWEDSPIVGLAIKTNKGRIRYRVHVLGGDWLPWVDDYDINDYHNGYAGNDKPIDAVQVYYYTPDDVRPYKKAKYKVNNYDWQYDNEKTNGQDGYAGVFGVTATKFQIVIE